MAAPKTEGRLTTIHLGLFSGFPNVYHFACVSPTALKLYRVTNLDTLFLVMGFNSLVDEIQFMLIGRRHICIRSIRQATAGALPSTNFFPTHSSYF